MIEELGASGITLAVVAVLRQSLELGPRGSMIAALAASVMVTTIVTLAFWPVDLRMVPVQALQNWLVAMGAWSGGKALAGK